MKLLFEVELKTEPNPDTYEHNKYILEKHLNDAFVRAESYPQADEPNNT